MRRRDFITLLGSAALAWPRFAKAQQASRINRIGFLRVGPAPKSFIDGFQQGLRELGYRDGQDIAIEYGLAQSPAQLPEVAAELVRLKVDVIVASGTPSILPARHATSTIPVVFVAAIDPVAAGITASLNRPAGNITGLTTMHAELLGKRFQLLKEVLPKLSRIAVLARAASPATGRYAREAELAARALGVQLQVLAVHDPPDFDEAFGAAQGADALLGVDDPVFTAHRARIAELALKKRLPTIYGFSEMVEAGGLMAYGPDVGDLYRRAAIQVHKILKGANPAELPVEQPTKFELIVNLKTAKALGIAIPSSVLVRADEVIE